MYQPSRSGLLPSSLALFTLSLLTLLCSASPAAAESRQLPAVLPAGSALYPVADGHLHVHTRQPATLSHQPRTPLAIVLLSGPNQHYHADSGWFALLAPLLAGQHRTFAIDRQSSGFSSDTPAPSYRKFAVDLQQLLGQLPAERVLLVCFASSSITARLLSEDPALQRKIAGLVLIDPDVPTPAGQQVYNGPPTDWYRANLSKLLPRLAEGVWQQRTDDKLASELTHIRHLIPPALNAVMDWPYLQQLSDTRRSWQRQQARAMEIANYQADLAQYNQTPWLHSAVPVSIIDGSFELSDSSTLPAEQQALLQRWQQEGSQWSRQLSHNSGGHYLSLADPEHLLMFSSASVLQQFIEARLHEAATGRPVAGRLSQTVN